MMKKSMTYVFASICFICFAGSVQARVWRVNNTVGVLADFKEITAAVSSNLVSNGDTLYVEGSATSYSGVSLTKKLVLIGSGYFLSGVGANTGLQAMGLASKVSSIYLDSLCSGSTFIGLSANFYWFSNTDDITITRCEIYMNVWTMVPNSKMSNIVINKCYGSASLGQLVLENCKVSNCIFTNSVDASKAVNGLFRNNIFVSSAAIGNSYISNNIFLNTATLTGSTIKYNIATSNNILPAGNNNQNGVSATAIFENTGSADGKYMLRAGSPAIGAGEPINGVTPDMGAFGTPDPYRLSGIPPIPTIYSLTAPGSVPSSATSMTITFSTRSNN